MDQGKRRSPRYFFFAGAELTEEDSQIRVPPRVSERLLARLLSRYDESLSHGHRRPPHHRIRQRPVPDPRKDPLHAQHRHRRNFPRLHPGSFTAGWNRPPKPENQVGSVAAALRRHPASFFP
jgi:hypothetical protein